jgi:LuxR family transcriptional regulator, maltose regulon positive regulatory protein
VFIDEGAPMAVLLQAAADHGVAPAAARRLLAVLDRGPGGTGGVAGRSPVEPLSHRERDVLRLLRSELTGPEIARELVVSVNTVRTHTKNIYAKLGVTNRRAAVLRAQELQLPIGSGGLRD